MHQAARPAAVAGSFYPSQAQSLRGEIDRYLAAAAPAAPAVGLAPPKLLVVPHAGYIYSAPVAAHAYAQLAPWRERIRRVVLAGPSHRVALRGVAVPSVACFETPLGVVALDRQTLDALTGLPQVRVSDEAHEREHSLEVQLPFLQSVLGEFELVPLAVGSTSAPEVAEVLERVWGGDETVIVISTDLSHYLPYADARRMDAATIQRVLRLDATLHHDEACGATPLNGALLLARRRALVPRLLDLRNSGDTAGDRSRVVGYGALAFEPSSLSSSAQQGEPVAAA
jgi:AmmeMemoRadiSam system protein B